MSNLDSDKEDQPSTAKGARLSTPEGVLRSKPATAQPLAVIPLSEAKRKAKKKEKEK